MSAWEEWKEEAQCKGVPAEVFFEFVLEQRALAYCRRCPVVEQCLDHALTNNEVLGVWGGTTEDERRLIRGSKPRRKQRRKTA